MTSWLRNQLTEKGIAEVEDAFFPSTNTDKTLCVDGENGYLNRRA